MLRRYEPSIAWLGQAGWSEGQVWDAVTGDRGVPQIILSAAHVIAVADTALLAVDGKITPGEHAPHLIDTPMLADGQLTEFGVKVVAALPGLNIVHWKAGLATPRWRRYL
jgi:hypothetical protein